MAGNFLSNFLYRDYSPIGLDVGHDAMKVLQLRRRGGQWAIAAGGIHQFSDEQRNNAALRWRQVGQAVRSMLGGPARLPFRGRRIVAALDHELMAMKNARLPKMPPDELAEAVGWEAAERFPFDVSAGLVRHLLAGEVRQGGDPREEVLMFAVDEQSLRETLAVLEQAGCQPVGLDAKPLALARAAEFFMPSGGGPETVQAIADIGSRSCQVLIARGGRIVFVKSIEIGSQDLTAAVVKQVGISREDAVAVRMRLGTGSADSLGDESRVYQAVMAAMRPVAEQLAQEITLCLRYYSVTFRGSRPELVTFVGGAAHDKVLTYLLGEASGLNIEIGRPLATCSPSPAVCQWGGGVVAGGPEWAVALGCCLKPVAAPSTGRAAGPAGAAATPNDESQEAAECQAATVE